MRQLIYPLILAAEIGVNGCANPTVSEKDLEGLMKSSNVSSEKMCGKYTINPAKKDGYFICFRLNKPEEEKFTQYLLNYLIEYCGKNCDDVYEKAVEMTEIDSDIYRNIKCVTLDGVLGAMKKILGEDYEEQLKNARGLYSIGTMPIPKVIGNE
jgi:hypothetical protein